MSAARGGLAGARRALLAGLVACAVGALLAAGPARAPGASDDDVKEYEVKAAFLTHFIKYTTWPQTAFESKDSPFVLLVVGDDPFGPALERIMAKVRGAGRPVRVVRAKDLEGLPRAQLVFLARSHAQSLGALLEGIAKSATLVVGDTEGLAAEGAHVNFYLDAKRLGFEVNTEAVKRSELEISSEMLKLARIVEDRRKREEGDPR